MKDNTSFKERFNQWKNGANYWKDIRGVDLNKSQQKENDYQVEDQLLAEANNYAEQLMGYNNGKDLPTYGNGKSAMGPSRWLYDYIKQKEGSDYQKQVSNKAFNGDPVKYYYNDAMRSLGSAAQYFTPQQRDALASYRYNVKTSTWNKTAQAAIKYAQTHQQSHFNALLDSMNAGYNDQNNTGLKTRRDEERSILTKYNKPMYQPINLQNIEDEYDVQQNDNTRVYKQPVMYQQHDSSQDDNINVPYQRQSKLPNILDVFNNIQNNKYPMTIPTLGR